MVALIDIFLRISLASLLLLPSVKQQETAGPYEIAKKMISRTMKVNGMEFKMTKKERIGRDYIEESFETRLEYKPFRVYSKRSSGERKAELLFIEGEIDNTALIKPG